MNKPAKLQPSQLTMILTLSAAFSVMCAAFPFTLEQLIGTAISIGLQILLCIPAFLLTSSGSSHQEEAYRKHPIHPYNVHRSAYTQCSPSEA